MGKEIVKFIKNILSEILDIIYPPEEKCIVCKAEDFIGLCSVCENKIQRVKIQEEIFAFGFYGNILKELILKFKYEKNFTAGKQLSEFMLKLINENGINGDVICYVPISKSSERKRGFNQCELLAKYLSNYLNIPISNCIKKVKENKEQKTLTREERYKNVENVFKVEESNDIKGKVVILIDDVVTTGATLKECTKLLLNNNVEKIIVLTIAKSNI